MDAAKRDNEAPLPTFGPETYRLLVESVRDYGIFHLDPQGRVATWNRGAQLINGYTAEEIVGRHFSIFYPPEEVASGKPGFELREAAAEGRFEDEGWRVRKDGSRFWANVVITTLRGPDGSLVGFAKVTRDLSSRREQELAERRLAQAEAERAAEARARREAESTAERLERLQALTQSLSEAATPREVAEAIVREARGLLGAEGGVVYVLSPDGRSLALEAAEGFTVARDFPRVGMEEDVPLTRAVREGAPIVFSRRGDLDAAYPELASRLPNREAATVTLPLKVGESAIGGMVLVFPEERTFDARTSQFLVSFARTGADALERARLFSALELERTRLSQVLEQLPSAVVIVEAPSGEPLFVNAQNREVLRGPWIRIRSPGDPVESGALAFDLSGRPLQAEQWPLARALRSGEMIRGEELQVERGDGSRGVIRVNAAPVRNEAGAIVAGVTTYDDVTEQRFREESIRFLAEAGKVLASSLDYHETLTTVARLAVPTLADWCRVDMIGSTGELELVTLSHIDPERAARGVELRQRFPPAKGSVVQQVVSTGRSLLVPEITPEMYESSRRSPAELEFYRVMGLRSVAVVPITSSRGTLGALTFVAAESGRRFGKREQELFEELASRAALAIENATLYQEAQEAIRNRDDFLAIASHELKTPLTTLELQVSTLLRISESESSSDIPRATVLAKLKQVNRQKDRLKQLVNELLDVGRLTANRLELNREELDLGQLAAEVCGRFSDLAARSQTPLRVHAEEVRGEWDRQRLDQVLTNLVDNALKYSPGEPVDVEVKKVDDRAVVQVRDRGIGVAPIDQERIFERFERAVSVRNYGGIGVGLWLTRQVVNAHGGSIRVQSAPGKGATFIVELPLHG